MTANLYDIGILSFIMCTVEGKPSALVHAQLMGDRNHTPADE